MKIYHFLKILCCIFLVVSITTVIQPVQSTTIMDKIDQIETLKKEINCNYDNNKQIGIITSILQNKDTTNFGLISWLINLIKQIIEFLKRPFEKLEELFTKLANFFDQLRILMEDIVALIDWIVRKAIVAIVISIIVMIVEFILYILEILEDNQDPELSI